MKTINFYLSFVVYMYKALFKKKELLDIINEQGEKEGEKLLLECCKDWSGYILKKSGTNLIIKGKENLPKETCLFVANHQGFFDIPIMMQSSDRVVGFVAKKEMEKFKIIKFWMDKIHCVLLDRENVRESIKTINSAIELLKNGHSMVIFPEGTRSKGPNLGEFKKGSLKLATKSGVPVVPVAISGSYKIREQNKFNMIKSAEVVVTICKPIYTKELSKEEQNNLSEIVKESIREALNNKN